MYDPPDTYTQAAAQYQEYYYHPPSGTCQGLPIRLLLLNGVLS